MDFMLRKEILKAYIVVPYLFETYTLITALGEKLLDLKVEKNQLGLVTTANWWNQNLQIKMNSPFAKLTSSNYTLDLSFSL